MRSIELLEEDDGLHTRLYDEDWVPNITLASDSVLALAYYYERDETTIPNTLPPAASVPLPCFA